MDFRRWHWRAFLTGGGSAFWLLAYGIVYWALRLSLDSFTSTVLYMGYLLLLALFDFLITGAFSTPLFPPRFHTAGGDHTDRGDASGRVVHCWPLWWWPLIVTNVDSCVSILQVRSASLPRIGQSGDYTALFGWTEHDALALRTRRGAPSPLETCSPPIVGAAVRRASGGCRYISSITYEILHHNGNPNTTLGR